MSGILSDEREALRDVNQRITAIERRLKNARSARDSYIDYLRTKYPQWRPALPPQPPVNQYPEEPDIFEQLETSHRFWDLNRGPTKRYGEVGGTLYHAIPPSGPLLSSDLPRMRRRLNEISGQLRMLRDHRSFLPTDEYMRAIGPPPAVTVVENRDMIEIQERLSSMQFTSEPVFEISPERIVELQKKEEMEQLMKDFRDGRLPSVLNSLPSPLPPIPSYSIQEPVQQAPPPAAAAAAAPAEVQPVAAAPAAAAAAAQPRVQFTEPPAEPKEQPKPEPPKTEAPKSSYQQILSLLSKNDESEEEEEKKKPTGPTRSFDDIFGKKSDPPKPIVQPSKPAMTLSMANDADSDDDFFQ